MTASAPASPQQVESAVGRLVALGTRTERVADLLALLPSILRRPASMDEGGQLAIAADPPLGAGEQVLVEVARSLIADQLRRAAMSARILDERRGALKRRMVGDGRPTAGELTAAGEQARMPLAERYWPAIVAWEAGELGDESLAAVEALVQGDGREHLAVRDGPHALVVLVAQDESGERREGPIAALVERVAAAVRAALPGAHVGGVLASGSTPLAEVPVRVGQLRRLSRWADRRHAPGARAVRPECAFALLSLISAVDRRAALAFVDGQIGALLAYDRSHGTQLADVLELALDLPHRADAAKAAYMHRNTFRRYLEHATEVAGVDLADPDARLAVHVALKLAELLGIPRDRRLLGAMTEADPVHDAPGGLTRHGGWTESPFR